MGLLFFVPRPTLASVTHSPSQRGHPDSSVFHPLLLLLVCLPSSRLGGFRGFKLPICRSALLLLILSCLQVLAIVGFGFVGGNFDVIHLLPALRLAASVNWVLSAIFLRRCNCPSEDGQEVAGGLHHLLHLVLLLLLLQLLLVVELLLGLDQAAHKATDLPRHPSSPPGWHLTGWRPVRLPGAGEKLRLRLPLPRDDRVSTAAAQHGLFHLCTGPQS